MVLLTGLLAAVTEADTWSISAGALLETIAFNMTGVASITCERSLFAACPGCELVCLGSTQRLLFAHNGLTHPHCMTWPVPARR